MDLHIKPSSGIPKFRQIANQVTGLITSGRLKVGDKLPSIDQISAHTGVARQTVVQAYKHLKVNGMIDSSKTRGFYVQTNVSREVRRVMVLFNIMSPSKEIIYNTLATELKDKARLELFFYNYSSEMFENIIRSSADRFHYFIIMPHYEPASAAILRLIPPEKLILIDWPLSKPMEGASAVYQDFKMDVFEALMLERQSISRYKRIVLLFPEGKTQIAGIKEGIAKFGAKQKLPVSVRKAAEKKLLTPGTLFITITDEQLITLIELQQQTKWKLGKEIGLISYNESPFKRILAGGIATLSSDFEEMGKTAAACILQETTRVMRNPFKLIKRSSL